MKKGLLDILYELLASPSKSLGEVITRKPLGWAILTNAFVAVVISLSFLPNPPEFIEIIFDWKKGSFNLYLAIFIWVILFLMAIFIEGGIFHLIAKLFRGSGDYLGLVCGLCFACIPFVFLAPITFIRALLGASGGTFYIATYPIVFFWVFILAVKAIRQNYDLSLGKAIATYFAPGILLIVVPIVIITVIIPL